MLGRREARNRTRCKRLRRFSGFVLPMFITVALQNGITAKPRSCCRGYWDGHSNFSLVIRKWSDSVCFADDTCREKIAADSNVWTERRATTTGQQRLSIEHSWSLLNSSMYTNTLIISVNSCHMRVDWNRCNSDELLICCKNRDKRTCFHLATILNHRVSCCQVGILPKHDAWKWPSVFGYRCCVFICSYTFDLRAIGFYRCDCEYSRIYTHTHMYVKL